MFYRFWERRKAFSNLKGEPIVNTPEEAFSNYSRSGMDMLVLDTALLGKSNNYCE